MNVYQLSKKLLIKHEGLRLKPYTDTVGKLTIGYGRNLTDKGITVQESESLLGNDIVLAMGQLTNYRWYRGCNDARQAVLIDMAVNLGISGLFKFKRMIVSIESYDYENASIEMLNSKWSSQVGNRAIELSTIMKNGIL